MLKAYKYRIYPTKPQITLLEKHFGSCRFFKKQGAYPKFHSKRDTHQSFTVPQNIKVANNRVYFPKFVKDGIKTKVHREIPKEAILKQATISRQNSQYFISILIDDGIVIPKPIKAKNAVGIDMGLTSLLITSDGVKYENKKQTIKSQKKLKKLQKRLSKKQHSRKKGDTTPQSNNYKLQKAKVQKLHTKISNQRKDYLHKISNEITNQYDIICLETLHVKGMIKNRKLAKGIADVAWSEFMRQLEYKSSWRGKTLIKIDKWFPSSQLCAVCGTNTGKKPLHVREFDCPECNTKNIDRDINASINIRNYGIGQLDNRNTEGTVEIQACGVSSDGVVVYNTVISYDMMKQEAQSSLAVG